MIVEMKKIGILVSEDSLHKFHLEQEVDLLAI
jgi:hypothetical protein